MYVIYKIKRWIVALSFKFSLTRRMFFPWRKYGASLPFLSLDNISLQEKYLRVDAKKFVPWNYQHKIWFTYSISDFGKNKKIGWKYFEEDKLFYSFLLKKAI